MKYAHKFDYANQKWDKYKMFHTSEYGTPFIRFANGMLVCTQGEPRPDMRAHYPEYNLTVCATGDDNCPTFYHDRQAIPKAWLTQGGQQYFVLDECTGKAWRLFQNWRDVPYRGHVPQAIEREALVFANENCDPLLAKPFVLSKPDSVLAKEAKPVIQEVRTICAAMTKLSGFQRKPWHIGERTAFNLDWLTYTAEEIVAELRSSGDDIRIANIAECGFIPVRKTFTLARLTTNKEDS